MLDNPTGYRAFGYSVGARGFEPPTSWSRSGDQVYRRTTKCRTYAVFWAVGVVPWELKSLRSGEKLTPKLTPRATSWTDFRRSFPGGVLSPPLEPTRTARGASYDTK